MILGVLVTAAVSVWSVHGQTVGNNDCLNNSLDWYVKSVGETPCRTYERLRQNCNPTYQTPTFATSVPGDTCTDQVSVCCCNSVAFTLSMLCMSCQSGRGTSLNDDMGLDSPLGGYQKYLGSCSPATNASLPDTLQKGVCLQKINIPRYVYQPFWPDGSWFYQYVKEVAQLQITSNTNNTGLCPEEEPSRTDLDLKVAGIVGGVLGAVVFVLVGALVWCYRQLAALRRGYDELVLAPKGDESDLVFRANSHHPVTFLQYTPISGSHDASPSSPPPRPHTHRQHSNERHLKVALPAPRNLHEHVPSPPVNSRNAVESRPLMQCTLSSNRRSSGRTASGGISSSEGRLPPSYYR